MRGKWFFNSLNLASAIAMDSSIDLFGFFATPSDNKTRVRPRPSESYEDKGEGL